MKAIILAAGSGTRMGKYGQDRPKCMLDIQDKPLISWQLEALRAAGINDLIVVTGYRADLVTPPGVRTYHNTDWETTNMVESLMCARDEFDDDVLITYGDVLYTAELVGQMMATDAQVSVAVDTAWRLYWQVRYGTTERDIESLTISNGRIIELGRPLESSLGVEHRYIGVLRFVKDAWGPILDIYDEAKRQEARWLASGKSFRQGYMTDLLNEMITQGVCVQPTIFEHHWWEFDTESDYEIACRLCQTGQMQQFLPGALAR